LSQSWSSTPPPRFPTPPTPVSPFAGKQRLGLIVGGAVVALLAAGGVGFALGRSSSGPSPSEAAEAASAQESRLNSAFAACESRDSDKTLSLEDDGATIVIDTGSEYGDPFGMDCVLTELGTPQSIQAEMGRTTALMGEHEGLTFSWSYHPDNGVNMVITDAAASAGD
jgi:hypothetical protein